MRTPEEILPLCIVEGFVLKLPGELDYKGEYIPFKQKMDLIGGKWTGGKVMGFKFATDPNELLGLVKGDTSKVKKESQFFGTPEHVADFMLSLVSIYNSDRVLEPSAGRGALVEAIRRNTTVDVECYENMEINQVFLKKVEGVKFMGGDFLAANIKEKYDVIIANPPFSNNQDIEHIRKMYTSLKPGGNIVTLASKSWTFGQQKKQVEFREWLEEIDAERYEIPAGAFKESGTMVETVCLLLYKSDADTEKVEQLEVYNTIGLF